MIRLTILMMAILFPVTLWAQDPSESGIEMADALRSSGKIYVVVLVLVIILTGLLIYLINIDKKVNKLEKDLKSGTGA